MAIGLHDSDFKNPVVRWIDARLPQAARNEMPLAT